jgi:hypothetical protein
MDDRPNRTGEADAPDSSGDFAAALADEGAGENSSRSGRVVGHLQNVVEPFADHIVSPVAGAIGTMIDAASAAWALRESAIERRVRRQAREPLLNLYEAYPEARLASPRELGLRFVPAEEILGTAVAGMAQRGGDFLPLKPFRGENWEGRWQRIRDANKRLQPLPPVDLIKFGDEYWVVDGHNRVAATLYANGTGLDAMVTELVPLDGRTSERPTNLLAFLRAGGELRAVVSGRGPAMGIRQTERQSAGETAGTAEANGDGRSDTQTRPIPRDGAPGGESL